jgi:hypothetical protein
MCETNDKVFVYSQEPDSEGEKTTIVFTCVCGCVFSRKYGSDEMARGLGESAQ